MKKVVLFFALLFPFGVACADSGEFDLDRWNQMLHQIQDKAILEKISPKTINAVIQPSAFVPSIIQKDKNQAEFKLTMNQYLSRVVNKNRIENGKRIRTKYPTLLSRTYDNFKVQPNVILAFWGMESNYGTFKSAYKLTDAFLTLVYDGRRETFFTKQLFALMKIADKNNLDIGAISGSWAGAMGHFQFIPTTLEQYGMDGNGDGKIDIINSESDAMFSAGNYLSKLGWNENERIVREIKLPDDFDAGLCDGKTKKTLDEWRALGITDAPKSDMTAGIICDTAEIKEYRTNAKSPEYGMLRPRAFLAYPNFYRIKKWNNSNWYAVAIALLADSLR